MKTIMNTCLSLIGIGLLTFMVSMPSFAKGAPNQAYQLAQMFPPSSDSGWSSLKSKQIHKKSAPKQSPKIEGGDIFKAKP